MSASNKPAFPRPFSSDEREGRYPDPMPPQTGMTLRQWYAGKALAICDQNMTRRGINMSYENIAKSAFEIADAIAFVGYIIFIRCLEFADPEMCSQVRQAVADGFSKYPPTEPPL